MRPIVLVGGPACGREELVSGEPTLQPPGPEADIDRLSREERRERFARELKGYSESEYRPTGRKLGDHEIYAWAADWPANPAAATLPDAHRFSPMLRLGDPFFRPSPEVHRFMRAVHFEDDEPGHADVCTLCGAVKKLASGEILPPRPDQWLHDVCHRIVDQGRKFLNPALRGE